MFCVVSFLVVHSRQFRHPVTADGIPATPFPHPYLPSSRRAPRTASCVSYRHTNIRSYTYTRLSHGGIVRGGDNRIDTVDMARRFVGPSSTR